MNPDLTLYDLAGADASLRFSPHCWKIHMALAHGAVGRHGAVAFQGRDRVLRPEAGAGAAATARRSAIPGGSPATWKTPFPTTPRCSAAARQAEPVRQQLERRHAGAHPGPAAAAVHPRADPREGPRLPPRHARKALRPAGGAAGRLCGADRGAARRPAAAAPDAGAPALPGRRRAGLCRLRGVRDVHVGALHQRAGTAGAGRRRPCLARTTAGRARRPAPRRRPPTQA